MMTKKRPFGGLFSRDKDARGTVTYETGTNLLGTRGQTLETVIANLPKSIDLKAIKNKRKDGVKNCMLCEASFTKLGKNPIRHCKMCAQAVCMVCSDTRRQISQDDKEKYRICDECDTKIDNFQLIKSSKLIVELQTNKIIKLNE